MLEDKEGLVTSEILKERFIEKLKGLKQKGGLEMWTVLVDHMIYSLGNYDRMTPEAQKITDEQNAIMIKHVEDSIKGLPDDVMIRQANRFIRGSKGKRWHVNLCIEQLEKPVQSLNEIESRCKSIFEKYMQPMVDMYQDILEHTHSGTVTFSQIALLGMCFDELFVVFHLSQRSYAQQAYSHLRTIQEALDLINLFRVKPEEADLWTSDEDWHKIWKELKPGKVKEKIGSEDVFGKFYHLFSDIGTHPSFNMMRLRCRMLRERSANGNPLFYISLGGTPKTKEAYFCHVFLVLSIVQILSCLLTVFNKYLNMKEIQSILEGLFTDFRDMFIDTLVKPLDDKAAAQKIEGIFASLLESTKMVFNTSE